MQYRHIVRRQFGGLSLALLVGGAAIFAAASGTITTVAGDGTFGFLPPGDGGPATTAKLAFPSGVAVDGQGTSSSPTY